MQNFYLDEYKEFPDMNKKKLYFLSDFEAAKWNFKKITSERALMLVARRNDDFIISHDAAKRMLIIK